MLLIPLTSFVQILDQPTIQARVKGSGIGSYKLFGIPEVIQGAWKSIDGRTEFTSEYLYLTSHELYFIPSYDFLLPSANPLPSEYGRYIIRYQQPSTHEWIYEGIARGLPRIYGSIILISESLMELREKVTESSTLDHPIDRVTRFQRLTPRPGPLGYDFSSGSTDVPDALVGRWMLDEKTELPQQVTIEPTPYGKPLSIQFTGQHWVGGLFIPWGHQQWWLKTGHSSSRIDVNFEFQDDGRLKITLMPKIADPLSGVTPSPVYFRRVE